MLKAEGSFIVPDNVPANEFLNLEGEKLSTSRNHAVWLHEYLVDFPGRKDELRYVLTSISPETKDSDFTWKDYQARVNNELVAILGGFVHRVLTLTNMYFNGKTPKFNEGVFVNDVFNVRDYLASVPIKISNHLENFRFREALFEVMNVARLGNNFLSMTKPWELYKKDFEANKREIETSLNVALQIVSKLSILIQPFLPDKSKVLQKMLKIDSTPLYWNDLHKNLLPEGHQVNMGVHLFSKVEDADIEKQLERLRNQKANTVKPMSEVTLKAIKPEIVFDDFAKLDIRIGKVIAAEKMEKSDKLLKLTIDSGVDKRTILSGIAKHYSAEEMVGKQVTFIANLAPRKMMGIESQGMILSAEDVDGKLKLIQPNDIVTPGSSVS
jgi:methionyl-tRNA synthetase